VYRNDFRLGQAMRKNAVAPHPPAGGDRAEGEKMKYGETGAPPQFRVGDRVRLTSTEGLAPHESKASPA
jgi:hypothetical protein